MTTNESFYRVNSEELLNRSFRYYYTVDTSAFSNDDFDLFVNSLEKSNRNSTKKFKKNKAPMMRLPRACSKKLVDYADSEIYENISSGISYMEIVDESCEAPRNFSGASSVLLDVSSSYECLSSICGSPPQQHVDRQLRTSGTKTTTTTTEGFLNRNKSLTDIFSYFDEDVKINDSSTTSLHRIGRQRKNDSFLTYDEEKYDSTVYLYKKEQKSVDNMVNEFQRLKSSYLQQTLNDYNVTRTSTNTVGRLDKNRLQFFENMCASGDGVPNNTTEIISIKMNNTEKSFNTTKAVFEENEKNLSKSSVKSLIPLCKILPVGKMLIAEKSLEKSLKDFDSKLIQPPPVIPVFNVNLKDNCQKEKSFKKEVFLANKLQTSLNSTTPSKSANMMLLNHSSPITPPEPTINWETHPMKRQSMDHATQTTPKKFQDLQTNTSPLYLASPAVISTPAKSEVSGRNLSFTTYDASEIDDEDTEIAFVDNYSCFTFDDAPFININDKPLMLALENFLAIWDLSLIDMILALINENCNLTVQTEVILKTNLKAVDETSVELQLCHMCALAYESNEIGAVMKLSLFDPHTNKDTDVKIVFCAVDGDQMSEVNEKLGAETDDILIYVAFILKVSEEN